MTEIEQMAITTRPRMESVLFLGQSSDWWGSALVISLGFAAIAAVLVAAATTGQIISAKREAAAATAALERYKLGVDAKVADAKKAGIIAGETASGAVAAAAEANEGAKKAERDTAEAKLETEKLRAQVAWRRLSKEQSAALAHALSAHSFGMYFEYSQADPEAAQFAEDIWKSLGSVRGMTLWVHPLIAPPAPVGVTVSGSPSANLTALEAALRAANIPFKIGSFPMQAQGDPRLSVGSKVAPF